MEKSLPGFLGFDLDGTIIDNDSDKPNSAKYRESMEIISEKAGNQSLDIELFNQFYKELISQTAGLSMGVASEIFADLMQKHYKISVPIEQFKEYRSAIREKTYGSFVRFLGDENHNSGTWLAELPPEIRNKSFLVTTAYSKLLPKLKSNPNLRVNGKTLDALFEDRIVCGDKVLRTGEPIINRKPHPEAYEKAMALTNPENQHGLVGIAFEDSKNGILSAKNARYNNGRLFIVGIGTTLNPAQLKDAGADYFASELCAINLPDLIDAYRNRPKV